MQLKHIKESIKNKHANNGNKSLRNSYRILTTNKDRQRWACNKFKLAIRDSLKDIAIDKDLQKTLLRKFIKAGGTKSLFYKVGVKKVIEFLK